MPIIYDRSNDRFVLVFPGCEVQVTREELVGLVAEGTTVLLQAITGPVETVSESRHTLTLIISPEELIEVIHVVQSFFSINLRDAKDLVLGRTSRAITVQEVQALNRSFDHERLETRASLDY